jgi:hypothetical protein
MNGWRIGNDNQLFNLSPFKLVWRDSSTAVSQQIIAKALIGPCPCHNLGTIQRANSLTIPDNNIIDIPRF